MHFLWLFHINQTCTKAQRKYILLVHKHTDTQSIYSCVSPLSLYPGRITPCGLPGSFTAGLWWQQEHDTNAPQALTVTPNITQHENTFIAESVITEHFHWIRERPCLVKNIDDKHIVQMCLWRQTFSVRVNGVRLSRLHFLVITCWRWLFHMCVFRPSSVRNSLRSKAVMGGKSPRVHLSPIRGGGANWSLQPDQVDRIFQALRRGLK